jgi:hypothetical protein
VAVYRGSRFTEITVAVYRGSRFTEITVAVYRGSRFTEITAAVTGLQGMLTPIYGSVLLMPIICNKLLSFKK